MDSVKVITDKSSNSKAPKAFAEELSKDTYLYQLYEGATSLLFAEVFMRYVQRFGYPKTPKEVYIITNSASTYRLDTLISRVCKTNTDSIDDYIDREILKYKDKYKKLTFFQKLFNNLRRLKPKCIQIQIKIIRQKL